MGFGDMPRALAQRNINVRAEKFKAEFKALPIDEQFHVIAGLVERGAPRIALACLEWSKHLLEEAVRKGKETRAR